jgi:hypothetical protein
VFAGPGSPTYALRQWRDTPVPGALLDVMARDGVVLLASAAALTLGSHTVPVYEIYKAGIDPYWEPGLNLVEQVCGLPAVVIPHYDNAEGGHHDTRYCYLGEQRLAAMERDLPADGFVLGVDEHNRGAARPGRADRHRRRQRHDDGAPSRRERRAPGRQRGRLRGADQWLRRGPPGPAAPLASIVDDPAPASGSLREATEGLNREFDTALAGRGRGRLRGGDPRTRADAARLVRRHAHLGRG